MDFPTSFPHEARQPYTGSEIAKKAPWADVALIVGGAALAAVAIISIMGIIHPSFSIPHIGTISAKYVEYALMAGSGILLTTEVLRLVYKFIQNIRKGKPVANTSSDTIREHEPPKSTIFPTHLSIEERPKEHYQFSTPQTSKRSATMDGAITGAKDTTSVRQWTKGLTVAGKAASLYGIFPFGTETKDIATTLSKLETTDPETIKNALFKICEETNASVSLQVGDKLYVMGKEFIHIDVKEKKIDIAKGEDINVVVVDVGEEKEDCVILGSSSVFEALRSDEYAIIKKLNLRHSPFQAASQIQSFCQNQRVEDISIAVIYTWEK